MRRNHLQISGFLNTLSSICTINPIALTKPGINKTLCKCSAWIEPLTPYAFQNWDFDCFQHWASLLFLHSNCIRQWKVKDKPGHTAIHILANHWAALFCSSIQLLPYICASVTCRLPNFSTICRKTKLCCTLLSQNSCQDAQTPVK